MSEEITGFPEELNHEQAVALGAALAELVETPGWKLFEAMLEKREQNIGRRGLRDKDQPREYYLGQLDAVTSVRKNIHDLIAYAKEAQEALREQGRQPRMRLGGGSLA